MKFFHWVQSKFSGGQGNKRSNEPSALNHTAQVPREMLTIGTFGKKDVDTESHEIQYEPCTGVSSPDLSELTPQEVEILQEELKKLLSKKTASAGSKEKGAEHSSSRFLRCPSGSGADHRLSTSISDDRQEDIEQTIKIILGRCKDMCIEDNTKKIGNTSVSFLLKKFFFHRNGFQPAPCIRDALLETKMEKLLRAAMLSSKIYPKNASQAPSTTKRLECRPLPDKDKERTTAEDEADVRSRWNKTDSNFIVLEI